MITAFTGTPGSGKTYDAVAKIVDNLRIGRVVWTNIRGMNEPKCLEMIKLLTGLSDRGIACLLNFFEPGQEREFWQHVPPRCLIVLDEVQNIFNSRDWQDKSNKTFNSWASTHRHHGFEVVLITQSIQRLDTAVRSLVEWTYVYRKVNFFGSLVKRRYIAYAYGGEDVVGSPLGKKIHTYNPQIFLCYKSYVSEDIKEMDVMKHVNVLNHPVFYAIPIVFGLFVYMLFHSGMIRGDLFGTNKQFEKFEKKTAQKAASAPTSAALSRDAWSKHTPSIWTDRTKSGQMMFSNRGSDDNNEDNNDKKNASAHPKTSS